MDLVDLKQFQSVLIFLVPSAIIVFLRSQFLTGRFQSLSENVVSYVLISIVYISLISPILIHFSWWSALHPFISTITFFIVIPAVFGVVFGLYERHGGGRLLTRLFGVSTVHPIGCSWDWRFHASKSCYVMVTLKNGTQWCGYWGPNSFASSDPSERDLYLEKVYTVEEENKWIENNSGVLISHNEIQSIEFFAE